MRRRGGGNNAEPPSGGGGRRGAWIGGKMEAPPLRAWLSRWQPMGGEGRGAEEPRRCGRRFGGAGPGRVGSGVRGGPGTGPGGFGGAGEPRGRGQEGLVRSSFTQGWEEGARGGRRAGPPQRGESAVPVSPSPDRDSGCGLSPWCCAGPASFSFSITF